MIRVWPVLKSLPLIGHLELDRQVAQGGNVDGQVGGAVGERHALENGCVGVEHRRGDRRVVGVDRGVERLDRLVGRAGLDEDLGAGTPDHDDPVDLLLLAEAVDVLADRVEHRPLVDGVHRVVGVDALDVVAVERGRHRAHVAERLADRFEVLATLEHTRAGGGDIGVVRERIPGAEHDVVELSERHEVLDQRAAVLGALAEADGVHLGEAADRQRHPTLDEFDAGDQRGGHGAEADGEHAEAAAGRGNGG